MTENLTEEQQVEALKKFWKEYGLSIIVGVVLALSIGFGWRFYHQYVTTRAEHASLLYEHVIFDVQNDKRDDANKQAMLLKQKFSSTPYASLAVLALAKFAVTNKKLDDAVKHLQWVVHHGKGKTFQQIARIRLARVYLAQKKPDQALDILRTVDSVAFLGLCDEVRGDAYVAQGKIDLARQAYKNGLDHLPKVAVVRPYLEMKLHDLH